MIKAAAPSLMTPLNSLKGLPGHLGDNGPRGPKGDQGVPGEDGARGSQVKLFLMAPDRWLEKQVFQANLSISKLEKDTHIL